MEKSYKITKLIICVILMCASLATALYFAIIPFVKVNTSYNIKSPNTIEVFINGNVKKLYTEEDSTFKEILNLYNDSFSVTKSDLVFGNEVVEDTKFQTSKKLDKSKGIYLVFTYDNKQEFTHGYTTVEYNSIAIEVLDTENMKATNAYIVDISDSSTKGDTFKYTSYAKQHALYEYLNELV